MQYLSEWRAGLLLKKECKRLDKIHSRINQFKSTSRKGWAKHISTSIDATSIVFHTQVKKKEVRFLSLIPDMERESLRVGMTIINFKKCTIQMIDPQINFSNHFFWRALQAVKTESIRDIKNILQKIALIIIDKDVSFQETETYMNDMVLTINGLGVTVVAVDLLADNTLFYTVKTFIGKHQLEGKHKSNYEKLINKKYAYQIAPGNKTKERNKSKEGNTK